MAAALKSLFRRKYETVKAVDGVSFTIEPGERVGFLGPNGAGKTTTLKVLSGLLHPTSGTVRVAGHTPQKRQTEFLKAITLVMGQKQQLLWDLPPADTYALNRAVYDVPRAQFDETLAELTELLGLEKLLTKPVRQLSLGERMKCELAAALLHRPDILFLDEPTLGLDVTAQEAIRGFLRQYRDRHGATVLLTSHYMADVTALASRVLIINRGRVLHDGALDALVARTSPTKRIHLVLRDTVPREALAVFAPVREYDPPNVTLEVAREAAAGVSARLLAAIPVADLSIQDPPIEEVIRRAFAEPAEDSGATARVEGLA